MFLSQKIITYGKKIFLVSLVWFSSAFLATLLRFDGEFHSNKFSQIIILSVIGSTSWLSFTIFFKLNISSKEKVSIDEIISISMTVVSATFTLFLIRIILGIPQLPRSVPLLCGLIALIYYLGIRLLVTQRLNISISENSRGENTLIYGAGIVGRQLVEQMLIKSDVYKPVGFIDDNPTKYNIKIFRLKIFGGLDKLENIAETYNIKHVIVAISQIDTKKLSILEERCRRINIELKIIPNPFKILMKDIGLQDITNLSEEDLLGRRPATPVENEISDFIKDKKILITGAGGSIGSEIARQVKRFFPSELHLLDRDEGALLKLELDLYGNGLFIDPGFVLADLRDGENLKKIISGINPDIVFHAAALKHLALLEKFPDEAFKTNCTGTKNLLEACLDSNVKFFVNISTDKAADPISNLGKSKLITERLISGIESVDKKYISVRFGNVIGSNGSFISTFRQQLEKNIPIIVTHPDVTRYFMTLGEAVHLVLQSLIVGKCGETLILNMGEPVNINDVARRMIKSCGKDLPIEYIGLRNGEKLHEQLVGLSESTYTGVHEDIMHTRVEPLEIERLEKFF